MTEARSKDGIQEWFVFGDRSYIRHGIQLNLQKWIHPLLPKLVINHGVKIQPLSSAYVSTGHGMVPYYKTLSLGNSGLGKNSTALSRRSIFMARK